MAANDLRLRPAAQPLRGSREARNNCAIPSDAGGARGARGACRGMAAAATQGHERLEVDVKRAASCSGMIAEPVAALVVAAVLAP
jgi:hypothetical protein